MYQTTFSTILPMFGAVALERGVPGYAAAELLVAGERWLTAGEIRSILIAATFIGIDAFAVEQNFDRDRVFAALAKSIFTVREFTPEEMERSWELVQMFSNFKTLRTEHAFDDWICESWWSSCQTVPYAYPSAMSGAVAFGLGVRQALLKCTLEYDEET